MADAEGNVYDLMGERGRRVRAALPAVIQWLEGDPDPVRGGVEKRERAKAAEAARQQQEKAAEDAKKVIDEKME